MIQFELEKYLENPSIPVITREGKKVRIICTDAKSIYPVIGLVDEGICGERFVSCQKNGRGSNDIFESKDDLFFMEKNERNHTAWINLREDPDNSPDNPFVSPIYSTQKEAQEAALYIEDYNHQQGEETKYRSVKIEWEE